MYEIIHFIIFSCLTLTINLHYDKLLAVEDEYMSRHTTNIHLHSPGATGSTSTQQPVGEEDAPTLVPLLQDCESGKWPWLMLVLLLMYCTDFDFIILSLWSKFQSGQY